jgi:uncharacterized protein (DUF58 family)
MTSLLDPEFLRELEVLRRRLEVRARSGRAGDRVSRRRGSSAEFEDHRAYAPGDDLRRIDWAAYARSGEPVMKLFRAEEDVVVRLVLDASASMSVGSPSKLDCARRIAAALGYMALAESERAELIVAADRVRAWSAPGRGRGALAPFLSKLDVVAEGKTDLGSVLERVLSRASRPGLLVVLSDFFDRERYEQVLSRAAAAGNEIALVQIVAEEDVHPSLDGDYELEDVETGETLDVTIDRDALDAYEARLRGMFEELRRFCRRHGGRYVRTTSEAPLEPVIRRFIARAVDA